MIEIVLYTVFENLQKCLIFVAKTFSNGKKIAM